MAHRKQFDWAAIQAYIDDGNGDVRCHDRFRIAHATWIAAIRAGDLRAPMFGARFADAGKRYDWEEIRAFYASGATAKACRERYGCAKKTWDNATRRGDIVARPNGMSLEQVLANSKDRSMIKRHLLRAGILENRCDWCVLTTWRGRPISIQIDHINGIRDDHRVENLRMLCPNCHSQTDTFAARNI